jgi:hypothetical protein
MTKRAQPALERISHSLPDIMKWIAREKIKVDRVACPWLIKNFIDPQAEFLFLSKETDWDKIVHGAGNRATKTGKPERVDEPGGESINGTLFDVPNCELAHNGEEVSFNSILKKYRLRDPALVSLGEIVRAADSHPCNPHPAGEGLRWIAHGFSELGLSDHKILEREFVVYDALFGECKRQVRKTLPKTKEISVFEIASTVR